MTARRLSALALVSALIIFAVSCTQPAPTPTPPATTVSISSTGPADAAVTSTATTPTVKIGVSVPLSGGAAGRVGIAERNFIELALTEINARGGVSVGGASYRLEAVVVDDRYTADGAREAARRLVFGEQARFILGSLGVATAEAQATTEPNKVLLLSFSSPDRSLGPSFPLTFQAGLPHVRARLNALYQVVAKQHPELKRVLAIDGSDAARGTADLSEAVAETMGFKVVAKEIVRVDSTDFTALAQRIIAANPDALDISAGAGPAFLALMRTLHDEGFHRPAFGLFGDAMAMRDAASLVEGYVTPLLSDWQAGVVGSGERELIKRYVDRYGERELDVRAIAMYTVPHLLAQSMELAGTVDETPKIAQVLRAGEWETVWSPQWGKARFVGAQTFGLAQLLEQPIYFSRIENGRVVTFEAVKGTLP